MKTSLTKLKSSLVLAAIVSLPVWAKPVAQVTEVTGTVFAVGEDGKTRSLKVNDHVDEKSDLMVEEGGNLTLNDYFDASYHLAGGSHMKFFDRSVQLKKGKVWVESKNMKNNLALTTANGTADYNQAEFIVTFDQMTSRSQFLVVNGQIDVANILDRDLKSSVTGGTFSMIDPEVENGSPRAATKVGLASLQTALAEFKRLPQATPMEEPARVPASVETAPAVKKGEIMFISSGRLPASVEGSAYKYWKKSVVKKKAVNADVTSAPIKFYGTNWQQTTPVSPRVPASVSVVVPQMKPVAPLLKQDPEFESSLKKEMTQQPKYSKELNSLIQDLTSY